MQPLVRTVKPRHGAAPGLEDRDIGKVAPVFIPSSSVETGGWIGPYSILRARSIVLTWAVVQSGDSIRYVDHEMQREWEAGGIDWQACALRNLRALSPQPLGAAALFREDGETWLISLLHPDGLGPSRLLLADELARLFPNGYRVALPERNRAFAFACDLDAEDADTVDNLIRKNYARSERPLSPEIFEPEDLLSATL